jgi:hypothetical protein
MYLVAVAKWARPFEEELEVLGPALGVGGYDLRMRLAGPLPLVLGRYDDAVEARGLVELLRSRGHGAVSCDERHIVASSEMKAPREFELREDRFVVSDPAWGQVELPYVSLLALLRAVHTVESSITTVTKQKQLSVGRAALTGGLSVRKTVKREVHTTSQEHEQVLYIYERTGVGTLLMRETRLRYRGLGERLCPTTMQNFQALTELLRERATSALYDERLVRQHRRAGVVSMGGSGRSRVASSSTAGEIDQAAHLLALAHLQGQLDCEPAREARRS